MSVGWDFMMTPDNSIKKLKMKRGENLFMLELRRIFHPVPTVTVTATVLGGKHISNQGWLAGTILIKILKKISNQDCMAAF